MLDISDPDYVPPVRKQPADARYISPGDTDYTTDELTRFNGLPGQPQMWKNSDTGTWFVVYFAPGTEPPIPVLFTVTSQEQLKDVFFAGKSPRPDKTFTTAEIDSFGSLLFGSTDTIPQTSGDIWAGFEERMERAKESQPWLRDDEVFAVYAGAWVEGRDPYRWELEGTEYWQTQNEAQREWIWLTARDPEQAKTLMESNRIVVYNQLQQLGIGDIDDGLLDFMAASFTRGDWSLEYLGEQTRAVAGFETSTGLNRGLKRYMRQNELTIDRSDSEGEQIRSLFNEWLGPNHPPSDRQLQRWSVQFRTNPEEARADLTARLRSQRMALFPEYEDENLTYDDIASPWRGFMQQQWGQIPDETDPMFQRLVKLNDAEEGAKYLRRQGIKRGNRSTQMDLIGGLQSTIGGPRNPV
jgi:hypothetical protein